MEQINNSMHMASACMFDQFPCPVFAISHLIHFWKFSPKTVVKEGLERIRGYNITFLKTLSRYDGLEARQTLKLQTRRLCLMLNCMYLIVHKSLIVSTSLNVNILCGSTFHLSFPIRQSLYYAEIQWAQPLRPCTN